MTQAVIVSTARTPLTKSWKGSFNMTHGATLGGAAVQAAVQRAGVDPGAVEDVLMGCANPEGATGWNIARQAALRAGLGYAVSPILDRELLAQAQASGQTLEQVEAAFMARQPMGRLGRAEEIAALEAPYVPHPIAGFA